MILSFACVIPYDGQTSGYNLAEFTPMIALRPSFQWDQYIGTVVFLMQLLKLSPQYSAKPKNTSKCILVLTAMSSNICSKYFIQETCLYRFIDRYTLDVCLFWSKQILPVTIVRRFLNYINCYFYRHSLDNDTWFHDFDSMADNSVFGGESLIWKITEWLIFV